MRGSSWKSSSRSVSRGRLLSTAFLVSPGTINIDESRITPAIRLPRNSSLNRGNTEEASLQRQDYGVQRQQFAGTLVLLYQHLRIICNEAAWTKSNILVNGVIWFHRKSTMDGCTRNQIEVLFRRDGNERFFPICPTMLRLSTGNFFVFRSRTNLFERCFIPYTETTTLTVRIRLPLLQLHVPYLLWLRL